MSILSIKQGKGVMVWSDGLNDNRRKAACHTGEHALLVAGPGTGKTHTLARRISYLVQGQAVPSEDIVALTFTRAAVRELRNRIRHELGELQTPYVSTLHSFALRTLLQHAARSRLPQPLRIADDWEERRIIQEDMKQLMQLGKIGEVRDLIQQLSAAWERLDADTPGWAGRFPDPRFLAAWREHRTIYGYTLRAELVYQLKHALGEGDIILDNPPAHLLVDEYQDLNACDLSVIRHIVRRGAELYAAGDDDQSIYGFRYADPQCIERFCGEYAPSVLLYLNECKRCGQTILDYGLYVARQAVRRVEKPLRAAEDCPGSQVRVLRFENQYDEAKAIAEVSQWLIESQGISPDEILVLLRSDYRQKFSEPVKQALEQRGIPVAKIIDPLEPLNTEEGRQLLGFLRLLANRNDHLAWRTLFELRKNSVGASTLQAVYELARIRGIDFTGALRLIESNPNVLQSRGLIVARAVNSIEQLLGEFAQEKAGNIAELVRVLAEKIIPVQEHLESVIAVFNRVLESSDAHDLQHLLQLLSVTLGDKEQDKTVGAVALMTMHQAKGLNADAVLIVAAEDEYIPGSAIGVATEDERRLLYVSLTRARRFLFITHCQRRVGEQRYSGRTSGTLRRTLTRFLSGGPVPSTPGMDYVRELLGAAQ